MTNLTATKTETFDIPGLPDPTGSTDGHVVTCQSDVYVLQAAAAGLPAQTGNSGKFLTTDGTNPSWGTPSGGGGSANITSICSGRLTLTSGTPITTSDVSAATTLYFSPYGGAQIALYDGTSTWNVRDFTELSIAVPAVANTMHDVFVYDNAGTATIEVLAWTNDTTRATALTKQNGVYVKSGAATRRYVGSFRTLTSGQTEDSAEKRLVWNYYNRKIRFLRRYDSTASWNYSTSTWRQANGSASNQVALVIGVSEETVEANLTTTCQNSTSTARTVYAALNLDSTAGSPVFTLGSNTTVGGFTNNSVDITHPGEGYVAAGYHYIAWVEYGGGTDTQTWYCGSVRGIQGHMVG